MKSHHFGTTGYLSIRLSQCGKNSKLADKIFHIFNSANVSIDEIGCFLTVLTWCWANRILFLISMHAIFWGQNKLRLLHLVSAWIVYDSLIVWYFIWTDKTDE